MQKTTFNLPQQVVSLALDEARHAFQTDEIPVGAVVFDTSSGEIVAFAHNQTIQDKNPTAHAEILAIAQACNRLNVKQLNGFSLFTTLEPCVMCAGAISWAKLDAVIFGAKDPKTGAVHQGAQVYTHPQTHHKPLVLDATDVDLIDTETANACGNIMTEFFKLKRKNEK